MSVPKSSSRIATVSVLIPFAILLALLANTTVLCAADAKAPPAPDSSSLASNAPESLPKGTQLVKIEAHPAAIELTHRFDYRQLLLTGVTAAGDRFDVTRLAKLSASANNGNDAARSPAGASSVVAVSDNRLVRAAADGSDELKFTVGDQSVVVPVTASGISAEHIASFIREVNPVLSKLGCNQGTCHGAAQGKNGFKLSLRGYDPLFDHRSLTDDLDGRRFNRAAPEQSLMLLKPSGAVPHVGGVLSKPGEPSYELLKLWIAQGSKFDPTSPRVKKIEVLPANPVIPLPGMKQQMAVMATFSDGTSRDVTAEAFVESGNIEVIESKSGIVTALRRGESAVLVRYEGAYAATTITVMGDRTGFAWLDPLEHNYIDTLVYAKLKKVKTLPSDVATDADFLRRVYIDLTGLPPTVDQVRAFLADTRDAKLKRDELVDKLVGSAEYVEHWTNRWADLLQVNKKFLGEQGSWAFRNWIRQAVATNMPYDQFVHSLLTASGSNLENPPASYYKILREPDAVMENTTQLFLGVRFSCNKCHDHPFERWTQDQHWQLAAYFAKVGRKEDPQFEGKKIGGSAVETPVAMVEVIYDGTSGDVKHPNTNAVQQPSFPYQHDLAAMNARGPRDQFARWATSPQNEYFAKSYVNRLWSYLLGVGFIEPIDDIRAGNPPTNPELLDRLTREFLEHKFDTQHMLRLICKSRVYQHSIVPNRWNEDDGINYSHAIARRLPAEVLFDAVHQATGSVRRLPGMPAGSRAAQQRDSGVNNADGFLDLFGRPARESACECERVGGVMLGQTLNLINGPTVAQAIADTNNDIGKLIAKEKDDAKVVQELFLRVLARPATDSELQRGIAALRAEDDGLQKAKHALASYEEQLPSKQAVWEKEIAAFSWVPLDATSLKSSAGAEFTKESDHSIRVGGKLAKDLYNITAHSDLPNITGIRLEVLADSRLPGGGPGRAENGNLVLHEFKLSAGPKSAGAPSADASDKTSDALKPITLQNALADFSQKGFPVGGAIDGNSKTGWAVMPNNGAVVGKSHTATFETKTDIKFEGGATLSFTLDQQYQDGQHNIGKFRISVTNGRRPLMLTGPPEQVAAIVAVPLDKRTPEQRAELEKYFRSLDGELARLQAARDEATKLDVDKRLAGAQDLVWALINSPSFLFNR